jgi:rubrerythrin
MSKLTGSKTEENLKAAFAGEAQAHTKYLYYASKAKKEGYEQIGSIFEETAKNEKEHAKLWYKLLHEGVGTTTENLVLAAEGENYEWTEMYKSFAEEARKEGFNEIAAAFEGVGKVEREHEARYHRLLDNIKENRVFNREEKIAWKCGNCGHIHFGADAPKICPVCSHPQGFFEIKAENY